MKITIKNLKFNKKMLTEDVSYFLRNLLIQEYSNSEGKISFTFYRPCFEKAKRDNLLFFIPRWQVPYVKTRVEISPVSEVVESNIDPWNHKDYGDWFHCFEMVSNKKIIVHGSLGKASFNINEKTCLQIEDIEKPYQDNVHFDSKSFIERQKKWFSDIVEAAKETCKKH